MTLICNIVQTEESQQRVFNMKKELLSLQVLFIINGMSKINSRLNTKRTFTCE